MSNIPRLKPLPKARIGLYSAGLNAYWDQFAGLKDTLLGYNKFLAESISEYGEVFNYGLVDTSQRGYAAGEYFNQNNVDIIFSHAATYYTSATVLPIHQICKAPTVILNLQPTPEMAYEITGTDRWLAQCVSCPIPEISNAFERSGISFHAVNGLLGLKETPEFALADEKTDKRPEAIEAWKQIKEWCQAAKVKRTISSAKFGYLGGYYSGMLDMYSDFTMLQAQTGMQVECLEMCDLDQYLEEATEEEIQIKIDQALEFFQVSEPSPSDPIAKKPSEEQLRWAAKIAVAQEKMVKEFKLDSLTYYYHGRRNNHYEQLQGGFTLGHSLLTAAGIPCAGEGDIKTALAMKICDTLQTGGSYCEIIASDFNRNTIVVGHDGPFHISIAAQKPILRGMSLIHGKRGSGVAVEAKVKHGPVTTLAVTQTIQGRLRFVISEGESIDAPVLMNGNTSTHVRFDLPPAKYMDKWFPVGATHHFALAIGHNKDLLLKVAELMDIEAVVI